MHKKKKIIGVSV